MTCTSNQIHRRGHLDLAERWVLSSHCADAGLALGEGEGEYGESEAAAAAVVWETAGRATARARAVRATATVTPLKAAVPTGSRLRSSACRAQDTAAPCTWRTGPSAWSPHAGSTLGPGRRMLPVASSVQARVRMGKAMAAVARRAAAALAGSTRR